TPSPGANSPPGVLLNGCLRHRKGDSAQPFNVTWKEVTSRQSRPQKSRNCLLNSVFSGNAGACHAESTPATTGTGRTTARAAAPPWRRAVDFDRFETHMSAVAGFGPGDLRGSRYGARIIGVAGT